MHKKIRYKFEGFSLIEMCIIVALIGLLAAIATPAILKVRRLNKIRDLHLDASGTLIYHPDTKEVVELDEELTKIVRIVGKIEVPLVTFKAMNSQEKRKCISYIDSPALMQDEVPEELIVEGIKYRRVHEEPVSVITLQEISTKKEL